MSQIVFMGTPAFAATILQGLIQSSHEIVAVVTQPDRPVGRKRVLTPSPVKEIALEHDLPVLQPEQLKGSQEHQKLLSIDYDFIVTAAYGQFLPTDLLNHPKQASINVHASLLPKYRGGAPIHYAIWKGEQETGVSIIYMIDKMDAGDIISQAAIPIHNDDDVGTMFDKLAILGRDLLLETLDDYKEGNIQAQAQNEAQVSYSPTISRQEEQIDWQETSQEVDRHIRAFRPFPTTYTILEGQRIKIWSGQSLQLNYEPVAAGTIIDVKDNRVIVQAGQGTFFGIEEWQESGKKRTSISQWLNGNDKATIINKQFSL